MVRKNKILGVNIIISLFFLVNPLNMTAHSGWQEHAKDMREVLGLQASAMLNEWMKFISSDMIDKPNPFYNNLKERFPWFSCKHRFLFHWGYDANPWNKELENKVLRYCEINELNKETYLRIFKTELRNEQKRRNRQINQKTEMLFGFAHGGRDASYAHFFAAIAYDVHLLGDYMTDNRDLEGLPEFNSLIGLIITELRKLDNNVFKDLAIQAEINSINRCSIVNTQKKADAIMKCLKRKVPLLIRKGQNGSIYRRLCNKGFIFMEV